MTRSALAAWLLAQAFVHYVPRPPAAALIIAEAALETRDPRRWAATLDTFAALESAYREDAAGDCPGMRAGDPKCTRELGARSCGAFQTPCATTPRNLLSQARYALAIFQTSATMCPRWPLAPYAKGVCVEWANGEWRMGFIRRALAMPDLGEAERDVDGAVTVEDFGP